MRKNNSGRRNINFSFLSFHLLLTLELSEYCAYKFNGRLQNGCERNWTVWCVMTGCDIKSCVVLFSDKVYVVIVMLFYQLEEKEIASNLAKFVVAYLPLEILAVFITAHYNLSATIFPCLFFRMCCFPVTKYTHYTFHACTIRAFCFCLSVWIITSIKKNSSLIESGPLLRVPCCHVSFEVGYKTVPL